MADENSKECKYEIAQYVRGYVCNMLDDLPKCGALVAITARRPGHYDIVVRLGAGAELVLPTDIPLHEIQLVVRVAVQVLHKGR